MDKIADMLNMAKNASRVNHESVTVPFSKIKYAIAECLVKNGYVKGVNKKIVKGFPAIELTLSYNEAGEPKIVGVERVSKPSRRMYMSVKEIRAFKNGFGVSVLSTPKGILVDMDAKKQMVGGEILFKIW